MRLLRRVYIRVAMHTRDADDAECGMRRDTGPYAARQLPRGKDVSNQPASLIRIAEPPPHPHCFPDIAGAELGRRCFCTRPVSMDENLLNLCFLHVSLRNVLYLYLYFSKYKNYLKINVENIRNISYLKTRKYCYRRVIRTIGSSMRKENLGGNV